MPQTDVEKLIETLRSISLSDSKLFGENLARIIADAKETMRNLALAIGGLVAGSLVLLSSEIKTDHTLVLVGIVVLMLEEVLIFGWLLHAQNVDIKALLEQRRDTLGPVSKTLNAYQDVIEGKKTSGEFHAELAAWTKEHNEKTRQHHESMQAEPPTLNHWDKVFIGVFILGSLFVALGLLSPQMCVSWSLLCF